VAVTTNATVGVIDAKGRLLWKWKFRQANRSIEADSVAVSPHCDAVAIGGTVDYKYVWIADRAGRRAFFKTAGTPWAVKFALSGDVIAVATRASVGYLLSRRGDVRWSGHLNDLPITWPSRVEPITGIQLVTLNKEDVRGMELNWWPAAYDSHLSDDGLWKIERKTPFRGSGREVIQLWGPGDREPRWSKAIGCSNILISNNGELAIVAGDIDHADYDVGGNPSCDDQSIGLFVFDRHGELIRHWPARGTFAGLTPDGRHLICTIEGGMEQRDLLTGETDWVVQETPVGQGFRLSPDRRLLLEWLPTGEFKLFHLPR